VVLCFSFMFGLTISPGRWIQKVGRAIERPITDCSDYCTFFESSIARVFYSIHFVFEVTDLIDDFRVRVIGIRIVSA
jgi:hypothetical protein